LDDVLRLWLDLPSHRGGMHEIVVWYYAVNEMMPCVDMTMGIGTLIIILLVIIVALWKSCGDKNT
jgi:hypothetical protein